jgi:hypothetical protein
MRSKVLVAAAAAVVVLSLATVSAQADTVQFTVVDGVNTVTFDVPESPTPSLSTSTLFQLDDIQVHLTSNGYQSSPFENLDFYEPNGNVEFIADQNSYYAIDLGNILDTGSYFRGSTSSPTFVPGTYGIAGDGVTITDLSATPLPPTWTTLLGGLVALGWFAYRRRKAGPCPAQLA